MLRYIKNTIWKLVNSSKKMCVKIFAFIFFKNRDITNLFILIDSYDYVVIKNKAKKQYNLFPKGFFAFTDVDILTEYDNLNPLAEIAYKFAINEFASKAIMIDKILFSEDKGIEVIIKVLGYVFFEIHFQTVKYFRLSYNYYKDCLANRIFKDGYYYNDGATRF